MHAALGGGESGAGRVRQRGLRRCQVEQPNHDRCAEIVEDEPPPHRLWKLKAALRPATHSESAYWTKDRRNQWRLHVPGDGTSRRANLLLISHRRCHSHQLSIRLWV